MSTAETIAIEINRLNPHQQEQVLQFARSMLKPLQRGVQLAALQQFIGSIPNEDLSQMQKDIDEACERVEPNV